MTYDPNLPTALKETQRWFAEVIGRRIDIESRINPIAPSGASIQNEAARFIRPNKFLESWQRIQIYNQQYWWRLLKVLHDTYPFLTRLFGYADFNELIGFPYLERYPPNHWSLNLLGNRLLQWLQEEYDEEDKQLVLDATRIDDSVNNAFFLPERDGLESKKDLSFLLEVRVTLQPHIHLFQFPYDLFAFREIIIAKEDGDYWLDHDFPEMKREKTYSYMLFRNHDNDVDWKEISLAEWTLLNCLKKGTSIEQAIEHIESLSRSDQQIAEENLQHWLREWVAKNWITEGPPTSLF